jgi:hypothetical protein
MSNFQLTDITEDEIESGYLVYLSQGDQPSQPNNSFSITNIAVAEGINTLILDSETTVTAWTAALLQTYVPLPELYVFFNTDSVTQDIIPPVIPDPIPASWFTLPDNSKITNIQFTNVNTVDDNYANIVIVLFKRGVNTPFFLLGDGPSNLIPLSNLNNTFVSGNIPPTNINSDSAFVVSAYVSGEDPPGPAQLPPDYQIKMLISYIN